MFIWILTEYYEFIIRSNIIPAKTKCMDNSYKLESRQLKGGPQNNPIVHNIDKLEDQGEYHFGVQIFHLHQGIINFQVQLVTEI